MGRVLELFRSVRYPGYEPVEPATAAADRPVLAALGMGQTDGTLGTFRVGDGLTCAGLSITREQAISIPAVKRARNEIVSVVSSMPFTFWRDPATVEDVAEQIEPALWAKRPDPNRTRQWFLAGTVDDLIFHARAMWRVTSKTTAGFPATFELMRFRNVQVAPDLQSVIWTDPLRNNARITVSARDVVEFLSPNDALLEAGARALLTIIALDRSAARHADHDVPSGWIEMEGEAPEWVEDDQGLKDFLDAIASGWHAARMSNTTGALPTGLAYKESQSNPEKMQLLESRQHGATEVARLMDVPGWFIGAQTPGSSLTYQNAQQARVDAIDFGPAPYIRCIEETLSGPNVSPRGVFVKLDPTEWLDVATVALSTPDGDQATQTQEVPA